MKPLSLHFNQASPRSSLGIVQTSIWLALGLAAALTVRHYDSATNLSFEQFLLLRIQIKNFLVASGLFSVSIALASLIFRYARIENFLARGLLLALGTTGLCFGAASMFDLEAVNSTFLGALFASQVVGHWATDFVHQRKRGMKKALHVVIVGTSERAVSMARKVSADPTADYHVLGFVDKIWRAQPDFGGTDLDMISDYKEFGDYLKENVVDLVVFCIPAERVDVATVRLIEQCQEQGLGVVFDTQSIYPSLRSPHVASCFGGNGMVLAPNMGRSFAWSIKRMADFVLSGLGLLALAVPFLGVAAAVRLTSPGPVFFRQVRIGYNKRRFTLYKFRTMVEDAESMMADLEVHNEVDGAAFKMRNDPRVTKVGAFLRRTSIDELPQLWNVLIGDMSLVGPRPFPLRDYANFSDLRHCRRQGITPGLTCLWQVGGRSSMSYDDWMRSDLEYIDKWSLWLDLKILIKTIPTVLRQSGAY